MAGLSYYAALMQASQNLLPGSCSLCRGSLKRFDNALCQRCIAELPRLTSSCQRCAVPLASDFVCAACQLTPPVFRRCIAAFRYQPPINSIIVRLKSDAYIAELQQLSAVLAERITVTYREAQQVIPQVVIPLPLHWLKMTRRGFNQSHILCQLLAKHFSRQHNTALNLRTDICRRIAQGQAQHLLSAKQRLSGIKNAFIAEQPVNVSLKGLSVAVVDDVVTTGATANSVAAALLRAGVKDVDIWCLARTSWNNSAG